MRALRPPRELPAFSYVHKLSPLEQKLNVGLDLLYIALDFSGLPKLNQALNQTGREMEEYRGT